MGTGVKGAEADFSLASEIVPHTTASIQPHFQFWQSRGERLEDRVHLPLLFNAQREVFAV